jgi:hypothetical protein
MGFALVIRELTQRWRLLIVGVVLAAAVAVLSVYRLDGFALKKRGLQHSSASTQVLVDTPSSSLGNLSGATEPLNVRATVYANLMATPAVLDLIGKQLGIEGAQIYAAGPIDPLQPKIVQEPTALKRNVELTGETKPYRLSYTSDPGLPTVGINAQAPTTPQAIALANAAATGLQKYVASLQQGAKVPAAKRVTIRQLGSANGGVDNGGIGKALAFLVFIAVFGAWCLAVLVASRLRTNWIASGLLASSLERDPEGAIAAGREDDPREIGLGGRRELTDGYDDQDEVRGPTRVAS